MSTLLREQPAVGQAYDKYQQFNHDARMRALDEAHQRFLHDQATDLEEAHTKGRAEEKIEIAQNLKEMGLDIIQISQATGLPTTLIEGLG